MKWHKIIIIRGKRRLEILYLVSAESAFGSNAEFGNIVPSYILKPTILPSRELPKRSSSFGIQGIYSNSIVILMKLSTARDLIGTTNNSILRNLF